MSIVKNDNDKMDADVIENRAETYTGMMNAGYKFGMPISLGFVMLITLLMIGVGAFTSIFLSILTAIGVFAFVKTFLIH